MLFRDDQARDNSSSSALMSSESAMLAESDNSGSQINIAMAQDLEMIQEETGEYGSSQMESSSQPM